MAGLHKISDYAAPAVTQSSDVLTATLFRYSTKLQLIHAWTKITPAMWSARAESLPERYPPAWLVHVCASSFSITAAVAAKTQMEDKKNNKKTRNNSGTGGSRSESGTCMKEHVRRGWMRSFAPFLQWFSRRSCRAAGDKAAWMKPGKPDARGPEKMMDGRYRLIHLIILGPERALRLGTAAAFRGLPPFRPAATATVLRPSPLQAKHQGDPFWSNDPPDEPASTIWVRFWGPTTTVAAASVIGGLDGCRYEVNKRSSRLSQCQIQIVLL